MAKPKQFSSLRQFFWPVHGFEMKKLIPMLLIFFFISLNYNVLRTMKDALVVTAKGSGAEVIPFIKVWVMFPMAIVLTFIYTRLVNRFSREMVFYAMMGVFLVYFLAFVTLLYPNEALLHPHALADRLQVLLPEGFKGLVAMFRYWTFTSFYVMSELWGTMILFTLFWGFANQVTPVEEAKRFYGLFGIGANLSGVAAGVLAQLLIEYAPVIPLPFQAGVGDKWLYLLIILVLTCGVISMAVFRWMSCVVLTDPKYYEQKVAQEEKETKTRISVRDSFRYVMRSRYLICIAVIVVAYNMVINLTEVLWKHQVSELYPNPQDYTAYQYQITTIIGVIATLCAVLVSGNCIRRFGWTFTAMLTPGILLITSIGFFYTFFAKAALADVTMAVLGVTPLSLAVFFGSAQNCLSRAAKYTVFDATRELAYVPLSSDSKLKGKAAIDGVGSRLGKSGGSLIYQVLLISCSTVVASAPYIAICLFVTIIAWIIATRLLGQQFQARTEGSSAPVRSPSPDLILASATDSRL
jgi:AAA family ATP:ADP antiporter